MKTATYLPQLFTVAVLATVAAAKTPDQIPLNLQSVATALKWQQFATQTPVQTVQTANADRVR